MTTSPSISELRELATVPPLKTQATTENIAYSIDMTPQLAAGQTVSNPTSKLRDGGSGATIAPTDLPSVVGNTVIQRITGSELVAGHIYYLIVTYAADANNELSAVLTIKCPI